MPLHERVWASLAAIAALPRRLTGSRFLKTCYHGTLVQLPVQAPFSLHSTLSLRFGTVEGGLQKGPVATLMTVSLSCWTRVRASRKTARKRQID